jgi:hypothetical protein
MSGRLPSSTDGNLNVWLCVCVFYSVSLTCFWHLSNTHVIRLPVPLCACSMRKYVIASMYTLLYMYVCIYVYTYIHTHTHIYIIHTIHTHRQGELILQEVKHFEGVDVDIKLEGLGGNRRRISGGLYIEAPPRAIWDTLTNYNQLNQYIPNIAESGAQLQVRVQCMMQPMS